MVDKTIVIFLGIMGLFGVHMLLYQIIGFFTTKKFPKAKANHKYAIVISARNESKVIGQLIDSINRQTYPKELVTIFVVADNCDDNTAEIARNAGAIVYSRFDKAHATKGYALQFLFKQIDRDYGIASFEAYFVFDADNILKADFIERMNEAYDSGEKIVVSYRNSKNIDTNWISAMYSIHFLRSCRTYHRGRSVLGISTTIQGTGYMFDSELVKHGWKYTSLTEDRGFAADAAAMGYYVSYCNAAEFYDEQPTKLKIVLRQRLRWSKGHLQAFADTGGKLFVNTFKKASFSCYDMLTRLVPGAVIAFFADILITSLMLIQAGINDEMSILLFKDILLSIGLAIVITWVSSAFAAAYILIMERKRIKKIPFFKKLFYIFMFPVFGLLALPTQFIALFKKVAWKPIPHTDTSDISSIENSLK